MSKHARTKEKQRIKREQKKRAMRRATAVSPYKRVGAAGADEACYVNADWRTSGMASIQWLRRTPGGGHAHASFLIDFWCAGLKDAWGRLDVLSDEFQEQLDRARDRYGMALVRIDPDEARRLVAASIRFARRNGFRLPHRWERWTAVLGGLPDVGDDDLRLFGKDGGLLWVGPIDDLRGRLIDCTVEEFLRRPGVHFVSELEPMSDDDEDAAGRAGDEVDAVDEADAEFSEYVADCAEQILVAGDAMASVVRKRVAQTGQAPAARLDDACRLLACMAFLHRSAAGDDDEDDEVDDDDDEEHDPRDGRTIDVIENATWSAAQAVAASQLITDLIGTPQETDMPEDLRIAMLQANEAMEEAVEEADRQLRAVEQLGAAAEKAITSAGDQAQPPAPPSV